MIRHSRPRWYLNWLLYLGLCFSISNLVAAIWQGEPDLLGWMMSCTFSAAALALSLTARDY
jgi:hypothetical protein